MSQRVELMWIEFEAVFNYDLPQDNEYYVHRIGRTGRAGRTGKRLISLRQGSIQTQRDPALLQDKDQGAAIPSSDDVAAIKADKILDGIGQIIEDGDLRDMIELIEQQVKQL